MSLSDRDPDAYPATTEERPATQPSQARGYVIGGAILAFAALLFLPIILGPIGAVLGFVGYSKGDRRGLWVGVGAIVATFLGLLIGVIALNNST